MFVRFDDAGVQAELCLDELYKNSSPFDNWFDVSAEEFNPITQEFSLVEGVPTITTKENQTSADTPYYLVYDFIEGGYESETDWPGRIIFPEQLDTYLPKKTTITFGERVQTIYYSDETYSTEIIKVDYVFTRDELGYLLYKTRTISWKKTDGNWCPKTKVCKIPVASETEKLREIKTRRENIIDGLKGLAAEMSLTERILELFSRYQLETDLYIQTGSRSLYESIENDTTTLWLNGLLPNGFNAREALLLHLAIGIVEQPETP
jgi:hypothetical protein